MGKGTGTTVRQQSASLALESAAMPDFVIALCRAFDANGTPLYLVGGAVRDLVLGRPVSDLDFTTAARPDEVRQVGALANPDSLYDVGEKFGTIGFVFGGEKVEITTFRSETYQQDSRKPDVMFGDSLHADLARRDFTFNAMAFDPLRGEVIDPFGGQRDLFARLVRAVGDPDARFGEDPLRILRACRFAGQLGAQVDKNTLQGVCKRAPDLRFVSRERIYDELTKILMCANPDVGFSVAGASGILPYVLPELVPLYEMGANRDALARQHKNVWLHTLKVVRQAVPASPTLRWAALLHDVAKPQTRTVNENGEIHFIGHEMRGAKIAEEALRKLKADKSTVERVSLLVRLHNLPGSYDPSWTDGAVRRLMLNAGDAYDELVALAKADVTSKHAEKVAAVRGRVLEFEKRCVEELIRSELTAYKSPLSGDDLMALTGRPPGRWIQPIKDRLREMVIDGELMPDDREKAASLALKWLAEA